MPLPPELCWTEKSKEKKIIIENPEIVPEKEKVVTEETEEELTKLDDIFRRKKKRGR